MKSTPDGRVESIDKESSLPLQSSLLPFTVHNLLLHAKYPSFSWSMRLIHRSIDISRDWLRFATEPWPG